MHAWITKARSAHATLAVLTIAALAATGAIVAQDAPTSNMDILRDKLRADKKLLVAANLGLTDEESTRFWPIYDEYQAGLDGLNQRLETVITTYADAYNARTLTDDQAKDLMLEALAIDEAEVALKRTILERLEGNVPAMKAVRYVQLEGKIRAVVNYDLAASIPLVE